MKIAINPRIVKRRATAIIIMAVIKRVLKSFFVSLSLKTATVKLKNTRGISKNLTVLMAISERKLTIPVSVNKFSGNTKAAIIPRAIPIKYLIQIFIIFSKGKIFFTFRKAKKNASDFRKSKAYYTLFIGTISNSY
jgi:hypothetical protein